ncbi:MAG: hypothetical protein PHG44_08010, partial [Lentisphaeria bacterium]|nr:hypothetical protein [Lentisphaeria bacterium]
GFSQKLVLSLISDTKLIRQAFVFFQVKTLFFSSGLNFGTRLIDFPQEIRNNFIFLLQKCMPSCKI